MSNTSAWPGVDSETAARRAGGRRRYNRERQDAAAVRRYLLVQMLDERSLDWGAQTQMAEALGVHRSTICRDLRWLLEDKARPCQTCGTRLTPEQWKNADRWEKAQWVST